MEFIFLTWSVAPEVGLITSVLVAAPLSIIISNFTSRLPLWSSGQSSWLRIQRSQVRIPALLEFLRSDGSERGPLSLVSTIEELLGRKSSGSGLENREYGHRYLLCWPCNTLHPQKLALTSPISGGIIVFTRSYNLN
jgi:hypothetical protein